MRLSLAGRLSRYIAWFGVCVLATITLTAIGIRADQYLLRRNSERLLRDLKSLQLRKSTYADAKRVIDRWYADTHQVGPCVPYRCDVEISFTDFFEGQLGFFMRRQETVYLHRLLGGRPAQIHGFIQVRNNLVWGKGIGAYVASDFLREANGDWLYVTLIGRAGSGSPRVIVSLHPEYSMGQPGGCTPCVEGYVTFTPYADPADVDRLMDVNFSCLTRWHPCRTREDILPGAWKQATAEQAPIEAEQNTDENDGNVCTPAMIRVLARESLRVAIGRVVSLSIPDANGYRETTLDLFDDLKPGDFRWTEFSLARPRTSVEKVGQRYLLFLSGPDDTYDVFPYRSCDLVSVTAQNLEAVRRGVSENWRDRKENSLGSGLPGLTGIKPPTADLP